MSQHDAFQPTWRWHLGLGTAADVQALPPENVDVFLLVRGTLPAQIGFPMQCQPAIGQDKAQWHCAAKPLLAKDMSSIAAANNMSEIIVEQQ